jgi:ATP-dependent RNA helicase DDX24/MAK5
MSKIKFRGSPKIVDLTSEESLPNELSECKVHCRDEEKDYFVYYFISKHKGTTIIFVNSVTCCRRLVGLLKALDVSVYGLDGKL